MEKKRYPGMYGFYSNKIKEARAEFHKLLNDIDDDLLTGLWHDGIISITDIQGVGRDISAPKEESVESSRKRKYETIERIEVHYERVNEFEIETTGDDDLDEDKVREKINDLNVPHADEFTYKTCGYEFTGIDDQCTEIIEIDPVTNKLAK